MNCTFIDLKCLEYDKNKEEEKEDNNDREEEEDNNNKEDNDIKEEEEARRAQRRPEGPHTRSWGPEGPLTSIVNTTRRFFTPTKFLESEYFHAQEFAQCKF